MTKKKYKVIMRAKPKSTIKKPTIKKPRSLNDKIRDLLKVRMTRMARIKTRSKKA